MTKLNEGFWSKFSWEDQMFLEHVLGALKCLQLRTDWSQIKNMTIVILPFNMGLNINYHDLKL